MTKPRIARRATVSKTRERVPEPMGADERAMVWVRQLRGLGVDVADFLERAHRAEQFFLSQPENQVAEGRLIASRTTRSIPEAVREFGAGGTLYSPSVLEELSGLSAVCRMALPSQTTKGNRVLRSAQHILQLVSTALRAPGPAFAAMGRREAAASTLALAKAVQTEAERLAGTRPPTFARKDGTPNGAAVAMARASVAKGAGLTVAAMQLRILRAAEAFPRMAWPEIMPGSSKKRHA